MILILTLISLIISIFNLIYLINTNEKFKQLTNDFIAIKSKIKTSLLSKDLMDKFDKYLSNAGYSEQTRRQYIGSLKCYFKGKTNTKTKSVLKNWVKFLGEENGKEY